MKSEYHHLESIDSTQNYAKEHQSTFDPKALTVVSADHQTQGRGRFNRHWLSSKGSSLLTTYCFVAPSIKHSLNPITLVLALSICEVLQKLGLITRIKWPNDIYIQGKKIVGILAEVEPKENGTQIFLGFGLNVNLTAQELSEFDFEATSLLVETKRKWALDILSASIEDVFKRDYALFIEEGFAPFHKAFDSISFFHGKTVRLDLGSEVIAGTYVGVSDEGGIILKSEDQEAKTYVSGEIIGWE